MCFSVEPDAFPEQLSKIFPLFPFQGMISDGMFLLCII